MFDAGVLQMWELRDLPPANLMDFTLLQGGACWLDPEERTPGADLLWHGAVLCCSLPSDSWAGNLVPNVVVGRSGAPWVVLGHREGLMGFL